MVLSTSTQSVFLRTIFAVAFSAFTSAQASTIWVGSNAQASIARYTSDGDLIGPFGMSAATGVALDGIGHVYIAQPGQDASVITKYNAAQAQTGTIPFSSGIDNGNGFPGFISDMAYAGSNSLWLAGYNGMIYRVDAGGSVLSSFDSGHLLSGVATDGTFLYTSQGLEGGNILRWSLTGALMETIFTGLSEGGGVGFDSSDGTLWVGGLDTVSQLSLDGNILKSLTIPGGFHDGLEVGEIGTDAVIPEPSTGLLLAGALAVAAVWKKRRQARNGFMVVVLASGCGLVPEMHAAITVQLTPSPVQPRPVGTRITWTATAVDSTGAPLDYRFSVRHAGGSFTVLRDFSNSNVLQWTPSEHEGIFEVRVAARNKNTLATKTVSSLFTVTSRAAGTNPVVSATSHPMVALYSAPACPSGSSMRVRFRQPADVYWQSTHFKSCTPAASMNFYVAGMLASAQYVMKHEILSGPLIETGPTLSFTTSAARVDFPRLSVINAANPPSSLQYGVLLYTFNASGGQPSFQTATDLRGRVIWYDPRAGERIFRPVAGGTFLMNASGGSVFREIDLVGDIVRETNVARVSEQLIALGKQAITSFHHETIRLPNGHTAILCSNERLLTNVQGPGTVDVIGDAIVVLDTNLKVVWSWNAFDHLDVRRKAVLNNTCDPGEAGCPPFHLAPTANDWLHSNSVSYTPDGHFLISVRHQDWVIKIDYANGSGTGRVIWRLGKDGDFTINSSDPYPWFSHQHDAEYELGGTQILSLYDNGNTRRVRFPNANSRGQVYRLDEVNRRATLELNADLTHYSPAVGSAQRLENGNYHFLSGFINREFAQAPEVTPAGAIIFNMQADTLTYRAARMKSLYSGE